jgi:hypothetical protein
MIELSAGLPMDATFRTSLAGIHAHIRIYFYLKGNCGGAVAARWRCVIG